MVDLADVSGISVKFDEEKGRFVFGEEVNVSEEREVPLLDIIPILLNKYLKYPEVVYRHCKNITTSTSSKYFDKISHDMLYVPFGLLGIEYMKTHVFYSDYQKSKFDCIIQVLYGEVIVIMQKNKEPEDDYNYETQIDDLNIIHLYRGQKLAIPTGVFYTFINPGMTPLLLSKINHHNHREIDYSTLRKEKGLACFVISKNAKVETVANPKYKIAYRLKPVSLKQFIDKRGEDGYYCDVYDSSDPICHINSKLVKVFAV